MTEFVIGTDPVKEPTMGSVCTGGGKKSINEAPFPSVSTCRTAVVLVSKEYAESWG